MAEKGLSIPVKIEGIEAYKQKLAEVEKNIEELDKSIDELNNIKITISVNDN